MKEEANGVDEGERGTGNNPRCGLQNNPHWGTRTGEDPAMQGSQLVTSLDKLPQECELCFRQPTHKLPAPGETGWHNHTFQLEVSVLHLKYPQDPE